MKPQSPCSHRIDQKHLLSGMKRHIGNTGRKGGRNVLDAKNLHAPSHTTVPCRHHNLPIKRRPRGRRPDDGKNRPVSLMGLVWTQGMRSMARKLSLHANMAKLSSFNPASAFNPATLRMAFQAPSKFLVLGGSTKRAEYPIIWDTGASISITMDKRDFVGPIERPGLITSVKGLSSGLTIEGKGYVMWAVEDELGNLRCFKIRAYLVPKARTRLLSVMDLLATYPDERLDGGEGSISISGIPNDPTRGKVVAKIDPNNNLPTTMGQNYGWTTEENNSIHESCSVDALTSVQLLLFLKPMPI
jgi:hypothetical protein